MPQHRPDGLHEQALKALAERHPGYIGDPAIIHKRYPADYAEILTGLKSARRQRMARMYPNVAPHYLDGECLTLGSIANPVTESLREESTADLVLTLAHHLACMTTPGVFDFPEHARKVAALWRELAFRGITLT
ncbi:hypothetical protein [Streptomyces longwoodensis]|uniref:hypothetical protein n=1 Tax=Streptomyces longwoodensis TaxID=68231 RepID=UPI0036FC2B2B